MSFFKKRRKIDEQSLEITLGILLRTGVSISVGTVLLGGVLNLLRHGGESFTWEQFHGEPAALWGLSGIMDAALAAQGKGIIQLGLILLVAVPVLRVAVSALAFIQKRDFIFVGLTLLVLLILSYSLFFIS